MSFNYVTLRTAIFDLTVLFVQVAIHNINPAETHNNIDSADIGLYPHARWLREGKECSKLYSDTVYCCDCSLRNSEFGHVTLYSDCAPTWLTDRSTVIRFPTWAGIDFSEKYLYLLRDPQLFWSLGTGRCLPTAKRTGTCRRYLALSSVKVQNVLNYTVFDATAQTLCAHFLIIYNDLSPTKLFLVTCLALLLRLLLIITHK